MKVERSYKNYFAAGWFKFSLLQLPSLRQWNQRLELPSFYPAPGPLIASDHTCGLVLQVWVLRTHTQTQPRPSEPWQFFPPAFWTLFKNKMKKIKQSFDFIFSLFVYIYIHICMCVSNKHNKQGTLSVIATTFFALMPYLKMMLIESTSSGFTLLFNFDLILSPRRAPASEPWDETVELRTAPARRAGSGTIRRATAGMAAFCWRDRERLVCLTASLTPGNL